MGDAESEVEESTTWNDIDILKVSHHGSSDATTLAFLEEIKPEYSIISVGANNNHKHHSEQTLNNLKAVNSTTYRTDEKGTIILISDGINYHFEFDSTSLDGNR